MKSSWSFPVSLPALAAALLAVASAAHAQALQIRHEPVACFMAERYPQIDACIEPAAALEKARVYFRAERGTRWSFVEMKPVGACFQAVLPPPQTATPRVVYYLSATALDRQEARTAPQRATVVADDKACSGRVGPFLSGAAVAVGGSTLPTGFIGAEGAVSHTAKKVVAAVVGAGAVGAGVALAGRAGSAATPTTAPTDTTLPGIPAPTSTTILVPPTTTTTTTTTRPPATTTTTTTTLPSTTTTTQPPTTTTTTTTTVPPTTTTTTTVPTTTTTTTVPPTTTTTTTPTVPPTTTTTTTTTVPPTTTTTTTAPPTTTTTTTQPPATTTTTTLKQKANPVQPVALRRADPRAPRSEPQSQRPGAPAAEDPRWSSELAVPGGRGQVILNGADASYPGPGRSEVALPIHAGRNTAEVVLVAATGRPGTWTFNFGRGVRAGSLRVIAGEVAAVGPQSLVLRLRGRPGERAVFSFDGGS